MNADKRTRDRLDQYVFLFTDCVPVKGHTTSAIYDLTRHLISTFPTAYFPFFELFREKRLRAILDELSADEQSSFSEFLDFLVAHEYISFVDEISSFPKITNTWDEPYSLYNAIIDIRDQHHDYRRIIAELDALGCQHLQVRTYSTMFGVSDLRELAQLCHGTSIRTMEVVLAFNPAISDEEYVSVVSENRVIVSFVIHSADEERKIRVDYGARESMAKLLAIDIVMTTSSIDSCLNCGKISLQLLLPPSTPTFTENHHFNGCLNRKLSVDEHGQVRNCPAMDRSFGDHQSVGFREVVANKEFRSAWEANNDAIKVCSDCAYRYACTGCRALLENPEAADSKPLKCGYDPYTDTWSDWRERPTASAALTHYKTRLRLPIVQ